MLPVGSSVDAVVPWPDVRTLRCLQLGLGEPVIDLTPALLRRGAAAVESVDVRDPLVLDAARLGEWHVAVAVDVLTRHPDPQAVLDGVAAVCAGVLVSIEPIDPVTSVVRRGRATVRELPHGGRVVNGWAHRELVGRVGARIEAVSRPFLLGEGGARWSARLLARSGGSGSLHRALVARVRLPGGEPLVTVDR